MRELFFTYRPAIINAISSKVSCRETIEDLTQDVFVKALINEHKFDIERGTIGTWLITIAKNTALDFLKGAKNRVLNVEFNDSLTAELNGLGVLEKVEHDERSYNIHMSIKTLKERDQKVVKAFYFERLKHKEIAEELGVSTTAVGTMIKRCNQKIKKDFSKRGLDKRDF